MFEINCVLTESTHTFHACFAPFAIVANWTRLEIVRAANEVTEAADGPKYYNRNFQWAVAVRLGLRPLENELGWLKDWIIENSFFVQTSYEGF